jgi:hypothetical protein
MPIARFAIIIGAMKSGTTSLFEYLAGHPMLAPCREKEPDFFARDERWRRGRSWYEGLWRPAPPADGFALEASTSYTKLPALRAMLVSPTLQTLRN